MRTRDIDLCKDYSNNRDECETCQDGYRVTDDNYKCLPLIENCLDYESSSSSNTLTKF